MKPAIPCGGAPCDRVLPDPRGQRHGTLSFQDGMALGCARPRVLARVNLVVVYVLAILVCISQLVGATFPKEGYVFDGH